MSSNIYSEDVEKRNMDIYHYLHEAAEKIYLTPPNITNDVLVDHGENDTAVITLYKPAVWDEEWDNGYDDYIPVEIVPQYSDVVMRRTVTFDELYDDVLKDAPDGDEIKALYKYFANMAKEMEELAIKEEELAKTKTICVINGQGGVGKDTLINAISTELSVLNASSIEPFKDIVTDLNINPESKSLAYRKLLSDLKSSIDEYCVAEKGISYSNMYLKEQLEDFLKADYNVMFVHIREPENIDAFMELAKKELMLADDKTTKLTTLLVESGRALGDYGNKSDDCVALYDYDHYFYSEGDEQTAAKAFKQFFKDEVRQNKPEPQKSQEKTKPAKVKNKVEYGD